MKKWTIADNIGGEWPDVIEADTVDDAVHAAGKIMDYDDYGDGTGTVWVDLHLYCEETDEEGWATIALAPPAPECVDHGEHDWRAPYEVVGGLRDNPGVFGHGGGVVIREVCAQCGVYHLTDTWAQRPDTGEQGLESVRYEPPDEASLRWVEGLAEELWA